MTPGVQSNGLEILTQLASVDRCKLGYDFDVVPRSGNPDIGTFERGNSAPLPMVYVSSTCTQNTANIDPGATNQMIIGIQIVTSGNVNPLSVNSFTFNATGTTNTANITNNGNAYFDIYMKNSDKTTLINPTSWETGVVNGASLVASRTFTKTEDPFAVAGWG